MRILVTSHGYPPTISGVTVLVQKLSHALVRRGHTVSVVTGSDRFEPYETDDDGVHVIRIASRRNPYWPANPMPILSVSGLKELIAREQPDVINAHDPLPFCLQLVRARRHLDVPVLATCHFYPSFGASYVTRYHTTAQVVEQMLWRYSVALYNHVDEVVFPTATHRDRFIEHGLVAPAHVISNGVDTTRYHPGAPARDLVSRYALPEGKRVLAVGRLAKDKDLDVLIRSIARLHTTPPTHLLVVGEGPHRSALVACAQEQRVSDRVHFLDFVPEDDLPDIYRASDVFAISSNHEVQSIPALQAAATGLPIVAVTSGSLPEICRDGDNGILVPPGDEPALAAALMTVLDPEVRDRMGRASERLARFHDENATFDSYESLYQKTTVRTLVRVRTREAFGTGRFQ